MQRLHQLPVRCRGPRTGAPIVHWPQAPIGVAEPPFNRPITHGLARFPGFLGRPRAPVGRASGDVRRIRPGTVSGLAQPEAVTESRGMEGIQLPGDYAEVRVRPEIEESRHMSDETDTKPPEADEETATKTRNVVFAAPADDPRAR